ncbi:hypothetical protein DB771_16950 [Burkholderia sp. AU29985]|nr:hypothetical protein XM57_19965 [Burkholderia cepacia]AYZ94704.1 hypothetical protein EGY28_06325 [Burkholderia dolosa]ETP63826.1 hypothetical protein BDSB_23710 [Burkholderia dolosa PC543]PRE56136.1 hypothetical protein C6P87_03315 [Burkholderia sp. AU12872]PUA75737.1 hypothetical protein DB771_16950 [Burkholderia sp. AU29985]
MRGNARQTVQRWSRAISRLRVHVRRAWPAGSASRRSRCVPAEALRADSGRAFVDGHTRGRTSPAARPH